MQKKPFLKTYSMIFTVYFVQKNNHLVFRVSLSIKPNLQLYTRTFIYNIVLYNLY